jgi:hypothetical protein
MQPNASELKEKNMKKVLTVGLVLLGFTFPMVGWGAEPCPAELTEAKAALKSAQTALKKGSQTAKSQEIQAPRSQAGAKSQDVQAPRSQDVQAPRSQDVQAPRSQDVQAPRSQEIQAPRSQQDVPVPRGQQDIQAPRVNTAGTLIRQADAACKKGDMALAAQKAREALALLK